MLSADGLLARPVVFATNELVLAVPTGSDRVRSVAELQRPGTSLAIGSQSVPVGAYTRELLARLPANEERAILGNVRSAEPDVKGVVGKLTQRAVDAGFVYRSDVAAARGAVHAIELPSSLRPTVSYGAGVVTGTKHRRAAREFVKGLISGPCADALRRARFGKPPPRTKR
jgi:molybdate transport system substrate-binding protein